MFAKQIDFYKRRIAEVRDKVGNKNVELVAKQIEFNYKNLEEEFKNNTNEFKKFAYSVCKSIIPGDVASETYVGVVSYYAKKFEQDYKIFAGFCLPESHPKYEDEKAKIEAKKAEGVEHPAIATHSYMEIGDKCYEIFGGNEFSHIGHIDVVEVKED